MVATWIFDDPQTVSPPASWPFALRWTQIFDWDEVAIETVEWTSNYKLLVIGEARHSGRVPPNVVLTAPRVDVTFQAREDK